MVFTAKFGVLSCRYQVLQYLPLCGNRVIAPVLYTPKAVACQPGYNGREELHAEAKYKKESNKKVMIIRSNLSAVAGSGIIRIRVSGDLLFFSRFAVQIILSSQFKVSSQVQTAHLFIAGQLFCSAMLKYFSIDQ